MEVFLVTYDLNRETVRPKITTTIREDFDGYAMLSESSYAVHTSMSASDVHQRLKKHLDDNDDVFVIPLRQPYAGYGHKNVIGWLDKNLPHK